MPILDVNITCEKCGGQIMKGTVYVEQGNYLLVSTMNHNCDEYMNLEDK